MTQTITTSNHATSHSSCDPAPSVTKFVPPAAEARSGRPPGRSLLGYGVIAGPLYVVAVGIQAFTRDGFDIGRHAASLLSNGDLGWIQTTTFLVTGLMSMVAAAGMRRALTAGRGRTWGPRLVGLWGMGLVAAGFFRADPMDGFPVGTPDGASPLTWHAALHMASAGVGFFALIAACLVFARRFAAQRRRGWRRSPWSPV